MSLMLVVGMFGRLGLLSVGFCFKRLILDLLEVQRYCEKVARDVFRNSGCREIYSKKSSFAKLKIYKKTCF